MSPFRSQEDKIKQHEYSNNTPNKYLPLDDHPVCNCIKSQITNFDIANQNNIITNTSSFIARKCTDDIELQNKIMLSLQNALYRNEKSFEQLNILSHNHHENEKRLFTTIYEEMEKLDSVLPLLDHLDNTIAATKIQKIWRKHHMEKKLHNKK